MTHPILRSVLLSSLLFSSIGLYALPAIAHDSEACDHGMFPAGSRWAKKEKLESKETASEKSALKLAEQFRKQAETLGIKADQAEAWQAYVDARLDLMSGITQRMQAIRGEQGDTVDPAEHALRQSKMAAEASGSFAKLADAITKLRAVLTEEQKKTLDQISNPQGKSPLSKPKVEHRH